MNFKKPITEFTFQDAEYIITKISDLLRKLFTLLGDFVKGIQDGDIFGESEAE